MYEVKIIRLGLDTSFYPPVFNIEARLTHDLDRVEPMLLRYTLTLPVNEGSFSFIEKIVDAPKGRSQIQSKLALDYHSFHSIAEQLRQSDGIKVNGYVDLLTVGGYKLARGDFNTSVERDDWVRAIDSAGKFAPSGTIAIDHQSTALVTELESQLRNEIIRIEKKVVDDPAFGLQRRAFESMVETVKQDLLDRPEIKDLKGFEPLISVCSTVKVHPRWAIAAALLSSFEGYVKKWLVDHAGETFDSMKKLNFDDLTGKLRGQLKKDQITPDQSQMSEFANIRYYRNLVIHEMYQPTEDELNKISQKTQDLMKYIESLKPLK